MKSLRYLFKIGHGPSSSHTMGPTFAVEYFKEKFKDANSYKVILYGSLALTGKGHLTDKAIINAFKPYECEVIFDINKKCDYHPNTMDIIAVYGDHEVSKRFYSVGGGEIEIDGDKAPLHEEIYPEKNFNEIKSKCLENNLTLPEYVYNYEGEDIKKYLSIIYDRMVTTIEIGLHKDGLLPGSLKIQRRAKEIYETKISDASLEDEKEIFAYAFATSEENATGGIVVTAPTCGSSGLLPAVLYYIQQELGLSKEKIVDALAVAGVIGNVIKQNGSISGAEAGCQAEIGAACSMGAAAYAYLLGANIDEIEQAAEIALEHHLGLTCDPVNGVVQIPCIERNAVCALRAISAAKLVIFIKPKTSKVSFDVVVKTMLETGKDIKVKYRETSIGGLAKELHGDPNE